MGAETDNVKKESGIIVKFLLFIFFFIVFAIIKAVASLGKGVTQIAKSAYEQVYETKTHGFLDEIILRASDEFNRSFKDLCGELRDNTAGILA